MDILQIPALAIGVLVLGFAAVFGDTATAAAIAGIFSTVNLILTLLLNPAILRRAGEAKAAAEAATAHAKAPRRFLYDNTGKVIGSVPEAPRGELADFEPLRDGGDGQRWHEEH